MWAAGAVGDKEQGGILWLGSCKHPSQCGRLKAKARPCVQCCRWERSPNMPAFSLWEGGQMPSRPRYSVSTSPSHGPESGREPLCWHRTFEGSRPNKREKKGITNMEAPTASRSMGLWTHPPGLRRAGEVCLLFLALREPPEAPEVSPGTPGLWKQGGNWDGSVFR